MKVRSAPGLPIRVSLAAAALLFSASASAEVLDASVSSETIRVAVSGPLSRVFAVNKGEYDLGAVFGDVEDFDNDRFFSTHAGVLLTGDAGATAAKAVAGLGARIQYVRGEDDSGGALALGGQLRVKLPQADRLRFNAHAYYGPDAASFGDFDEFIELAASVGYEILRDAELYLGYRLISVDIDNGPDVDLEDGLHVGVRLDF